MNHDNKCQKVNYHTVVTGEHTQGASQLTKKISISSQLPLFLWFNRSRKLIGSSQSRLQLWPITFSPILLKRDFRGPSDFSAADWKEGVGLMCWIVGLELLVSLFCQCLLFLYFYVLSPLERQRFFCCLALGKTDKINKAPGFSPLSFCLILNQKKIDSRSQNLGNS